VSEADPGDGSVGDGDPVATRVRSEEAEGAEGAEERADVAVEEAREVSVLDEGGGGRQEEGEVEGARGEEEGRPPGEAPGARERGGGEGAGGALEGAQGELGLAGGSEPEAGGGEGGEIREGQERAPGTRRGKSYRSTLEFC
jgi:hypothetical protein